jgi:hypothetical protein
MIKKYIDKIKKHYVKKAAKQKRQEILNKSAELNNIHKGQRCFIIGTGPSINSQDLKLLKDEFCIAMSQLYNHPDYVIINPQYHIFSGVKLHPHLPDDVCVKFYQEIGEKVKDETTILINYKDLEFIQENNLLTNKKIYYFNCEEDYGKLLKRGISYPINIYLSQSVSVMAIQNAIAMGFKDIYILGCDHDHILRMKDKIPANFYDPTKSVFGKNGIVENWDDDLYDWGNEFKAYHFLWTQYGHIKNYSKNNNINIYNATSGGILDVFDRVDYEKLF